MNHIEYYRKDSFGNIRYYITPAIIATQIKTLLQKETITKQDIGNMEKAFGVSFIQVLPPDEEVPI